MAEPGRGANARSRIRCGLLALVLLCVTAPPASAATPIEIGTGDNVSLVVGADGAAHVAWTQQAADLVQYCRVPRGSRVPRGTASDGCPLPQTFPPRNAGNGIFDRALVAMSPQRLSNPALNTVALIWRECCPPDEVNARVSTDGGASFPTASVLAAVGPDNPTNPTGDAIANDAMTHVGWSNGNSFQYAPLAGPAVTSRADLFGPVSFDSASAFVAGRPLMVEESDTKQLSFRRSPAGDVNNEANWNGAVPIPTEGAGFKRPSLGFFGETVVGAGPYLAYTDSAGGQPDRPHVREYDSFTDSFPGGPLNAVGDERVPTLVADQPANEIDIAADAGEAFRLDLVWSDQVGIWWSTFRGGAWSPPILVTPLDGVTHVEVSTTGADACERTPEGCGFAAARTADGKVWVVPLSDTEEPEVAVGGRSSRSLGRRVPVTVSCEEACTSTGAGRIVVDRSGGSRTGLAASKKLKLKPDTVEIAAGESAKVKPRLKAKGRKLARRTLRKGGKVVAKVKVRAVDGAGNRAKAKKKVKLK